MKSHLQKFKVWNINEKKWEKDIIMDQSGKFYKMFDTVLYPTSDNCKAIGEEISNAKGYVILFSTGYYNFKLFSAIYENDILRHYSADNVKDDDCYISYTSDGYELVSIHHTKRIKATEKLLLEYNVIGNVYSNPELLT
ncbi:MAG: YopX family protein [Candidatus Pacearchaeota archaeon]